MVTKFIIADRETYAITQLIECDLGSLLAHVNILEERPIRVVTLPLHRGTKLEQLIRNRLVGSLQNVDEPGRVSLVNSPLGSETLTIPSATCHAQ